MKDAIAKINYLTASFLGIIGISVFPEVFQEDDRVDKIDDGLLFILGLLTIWWYKKKGHAEKNGKMAIVLIAIGLCIKIVGIFIEHADKEALGDDIGVGIALVLTLIFVVWQVLLANKKK